MWYLLFITVLISVSRGKAIRRWIVYTISSRLLLLEKMINQIFIYVGNSWHITFKSFKLLCPKTVLFSFVSNFGMLASELATLSRTMPRTTHPIPIGTPSNRFSLANGAVLSTVPMVMKSVQKVFLVCKLYSLITAALCMLQREPAQFRETDSGECMIWWSAGIAIPWPWELF